MSTATEGAIDIMLPADAIGHAEEIAVVLEALSRAWKEKAERKDPDRLLMLDTSTAAYRLGGIVRGYARQVRDLERRRVEGFALGYEHDGKLWFLHHALHWGNLMRCDRPEAAALWPSIEALRAWCVRASVPKGEDGKGRPWPIPMTQLDEHDLFAYPVRVAVDRDQARLVRRRIQGI
ncbi:hypothetical protein P12x_003017 [Tundrisphaera lichenicola]|uniref:hypothetical protein n=1 Tax=Tundrisphaera lichenicola TaxID=2029860 RepID=UPI003EB9F4B9